MFATINTYYSAKIIIKYLSEIPRANQSIELPSSFLKSILLFLFSCSPFLLIWLNGLETAITLSILLFVIRKIIEKNESNLNIIIYALVLCRPEIGICTLITVFLLRKRVFFYKKLIVLKSSLVFIAPFIICKVIVGSYFPSSIVRVPIGSDNLILSKIIRLIKQLLHLPDYFVHYFIPSDGINYYPNLLKIFLFISLILTWGFILLYKIVKIRIFNIGFKAIIRRSKTLMSDDGFAFIFVFLVLLTLVLSASGSGIGEQGRYFTYQFFLFIFILIRFSFFTSQTIRLLIVTNIFLFPATIYEVLAINNFTNSVIKPLTDIVGEIGGPKDTLALDTAGILSTSFKGNVIDVYGLGTNRYAKIHGNFTEVYKTINADKPRFILAWETTRPTYYLDSAHYKLAIKNAEIVKIASYRSSLLGREIPPVMALYEVKYQPK
jgi:hypothetical protein